MSKLPERKLTDQEYLDEELRRGFTYFNPVYRANFEKLTKYIVEKLECKTSFEIGCGTGTLLRLMLDYHVGAWGYDPSVPHKRYWDNQVAGVWKDRFHCCPEITIGEPFDCIIAIEVWEHLTDEQIEKYMNDIVGNCKYFIFSSTHIPDTPLFDLQWGHINVRPQKYWVELFKEYGFEVYRRLKNPTDWTTVFKPKI